VLWLNQAGRDSGRPGKMFSGKVFTIACHVVFAFR
jgi:hypothetical protein